MAVSKSAPSGAGNRGEPAKATTGAVQGGGAGAGGGGAAEDYDPDPQAGGGDLAMKKAQKSPNAFGDAANGGSR
ncbi:MAG: hypothetical protein JOY99_04455 [Sphingomonadaceae bacterium]|nr:hypothetical protein [Sphingomonadaceae bacterium]